MSRKSNSQILMLILIPVLAIALGASSLNLNVSPIGAILVLIAIIEAVMILAGFLLVQRGQNVTVEVQNQTIS